MSATGGEIRPIEPGGLLLHVGTRKSGTTAVQSAFAEARAELRDFKVAYPGNQLNQAYQLKRIRSGKSVSRHFLEDTRRPDFRSFLSAEVLDAVVGEKIDRLVKELGQSRLEILITARPLASLLPSQWQQNIKTGRHNRTLLDWLETLLSLPPKPGFRRPDLIAKEWCRVVDSERIHVVLHGAGPNLMEVMAAFMDLPPNVLKTGLTNRGLTVQEAELVRRVRASGLAFQDKAIKVPPAVNELVEQRQPASWEHRPRIPVTFFDTIVEMQRCVVDGLAGLPVNVVGDLASWGRVDRADFASDEMQLEDLKFGAHSVPADALEMMLRSLAEDPE